LVIIATLLARVARRAHDFFPAYHSVGVTDSFAPAPNLPTRSLTEPVWKRNSKCKNGRRAGQHGHHFFLGGDPCCDTVTRYSPAHRIEVKLSLRIGL